MKRILLALTLLAAIALGGSARADDVGAVFGAVTGLFVAGPPGAIAGAIIGEIWGKPWWGPDQSATKCWIDSNFHRHCPKFPVG